MNALMDIGGRYATFVLPAYGISIVALVGLAVEAVLRARRWKLAARAETDD